MNIKKKIKTDDLTGKVDIVKQNTGALVKRKQLLIYQMYENHKNT